MTIKQVESLVRELMTTVATLVTKVEALEAKIEVQNSLIVKLKTDGIIATKVTAPTTVAPQATPPTMAATTQRSARQSYANTAAKINVESNGVSNGVPKKYNIRKYAVPMSSRSSFGSQPTKTTSDLKPQPLSTATPPSTATNPAIKDNKSVAQIIDANHSRLHQTINNNDEAQWVEVTSRKQGRRNTRNVIRGTGATDTELQTVERVKRIHACFFKPETTEASLVAFMQRKNPSGCYKAEKMKLKHDHYASFAITVPESKLDYFLRADNWPPLTEVSEWFRRSAGRARRSPALPATRGAHVRSLSAAEAGSAAASTPPLPQTPEAIAARAETSSEPH